MSDKKQKAKKSTSITEPMGSDCGGNSSNSTNCKGTNGTMSTTENVKEYKKNK